MRRLGYKNCNIEHNMRNLVKTLILSVALSGTVFSSFAQKYGKADTCDPKTRIPSFVKPEFDYWMRDTWTTLGPDGYYYMTGTTATPERHFPGQLHCWDWNDGLYLWRSKDMVDGT